MKSKHDKKVEEIANELTKQGYTVQADIPGYETPSGIGQNRRIPDIVAKKTSSTKIIEVETPTSLSKDNDQQNTFRRSAGQRRGTSFDIIVTD